MQPRTFWLTKNPSGYVFGFPDRSGPSCGIKLFGSHLFSLGWRETGKRTAAAIRIENGFIPIRGMPPVACGQVSNADVDAVRLSGKATFALSAVAWARTNGCRVDSFHPLTIVLPLDASMDATRHSRWCTAALSEMKAGGWVVKESSLDLAAGLAFTNGSLLSSIIQGWCASAHTNGQLKSANELLLGLSHALKHNFTQLDVSRWRKHRAERERPVVLLQRMLEPPLLLHDQRVSSRDYLLVFRVGGKDVVFLHYGYIMRCVRAPLPPLDSWHAPASTCLHVFAPPTPARGIHL